MGGREGRRERGKQEGRRDKGRKGRDEGGETDEWGLHQCQYWVCIVL